MATIPAPTRQGLVPEIAADLVDRIPTPSLPVKPRLVAAFAFAQLALFIALLGPVMVSMAIKVQAVVGPAQATTAAAGPNGRSSGRRGGRRAGSR